jgi:phosphoribosyl-AMP cyclohydrolase
MNKKNLFSTLEKEPQGYQISASLALDSLKFNDQGLIPAIAQCNQTKQVLMMAWMNHESIERTLTTGDVWYYSRSRQGYWRKGESSGHIQKLIDISIDCDGDTLLLIVNQTGPACHTLAQSCFFWKLDSQDNRFTKK